MVGTAMNRLTRTPSVWLMGLTRELHTCCRNRISPVCVSTTHQYSVLSDNLTHNDDQETPQVVLSAMSSVWLRALTRHQQLVSHWILISCQPHRVTSEWPKTIIISKCTFQSFSHIIYKSFLKSAHKANPYISLCSAATHLPLSPFAQQQHTSPYLPLLSSNHLPLSPLAQQQPSPLAQQQQTSPYLPLLSSNHLPLLSSNPPPLTP